jgi:hypothetical protein
MISTDISTIERAPLIGFLRQTARISLILEGFSRFSLLTMRLNFLD